MSFFQRMFGDLDPSLLEMLNISNTARCSVYCRAQHEKIHATYHKPAFGPAQRDLQCDESLLFQCASLFKVFISASLILAIDKLSSDPSPTNRYRKLKDAWSKPFTVVFNDLAEGEDSRMRPLPGEPSVLQVLLHFNGVYDINHILLAPDGTPLQCPRDVLERISRYADDTRGQQGEGEGQIIYSNANYILLALLIDRASRSLNGFLEEYILTPFKMKSTFLSLQNLHSHSNESQRQPHVVSSDGHRHIFRPGITLGLSDVVEITWLGPYTSATDLGLFFEGLQSAMDGKPVGLFDKAAVESLGSSRSHINDHEGYTPYGFYTSLNSTGPGSHSLNRLISPDSNLKAHILGKTSDDKEIMVFYLAGSATGWASTVYFIPNKRMFVIVLTNTSGPLDASDLISRLCLHEILELRPSKISNWDVGHFLPSRNTVAPERYRVQYVKLARQIFDENATKVRELEQRDDQPDTPTSDCPSLPGIYFSSRNGQYLRIIDWKGDRNEKKEGVLRIIIQSGTKSSQKLRFVKKGEKFRICSPEELSTLAIDCFGAWKNLDFEVEQDDMGVKSLSRQGVYLKDYFVRE
ncbi:beta-lactamase/transpeptidase-like protein [Tricladium varicosporioides]|nr:beta-lactamase/transpeptidase-like protein [Hymenoscyphus varicosporioides]